MDTSFAGGAVPTGITLVGESANIRVAIDGNGKVVVAAMASSGLLLTIERYNDDGTLDNAIDTAEDIVYGFTSGSITKLIIDQDNKIIVVGADAISEINNIYVFRILANMSGFDTTFNETGYIIYTNTHTQNPTDAMLHPDGRVVVVGSESAIEPT